MSTKAERGTKRTCQNPECGSRFSTYAAYWIRQGIGRALVERFTDEGMKVVLADVVPALVEPYSAMVERLTNRFYSAVTRYGTGGFLKAKLES